MSDDLVERLRGWKTRMYNTGWLHMSDEMQEVADRIEQLQSSNEALERELSLADDQRREWEHHCKTAEARLAKAVEALRPFATIKAEDGDDFSSWDGRVIIRCEVTVNEIQNARAVLAEIEGGKKDE